MDGTGNIKEDTVQRLLNDKPIERVEHSNILAVE